VSHGPASHQRRGDHKPDRRTWLDRQLACERKGAWILEATSSVWGDANALEACGFDRPFHDADPLRLADDLRNSSSSFG
jgi:hypothetical protein